MSEQVSTKILCGLEPDRWRRPFQTAAFRKKRHEQEETLKKNTDGWPAEGREEGEIRQVKDGKKRGEVNGGGGGGNTTELEEAQT